MAKKGRANLLARAVVTGFHPDHIVIVTGDFNDLTLDKPIHLQSTFVRIMYSYGFQQLIQNPTRRNHI